MSEYFYNRKERRALEKMNGLKADDAETKRRKQLAGKALQNQWADEVARQQNEAATKKEAEIIQHLMEDGKTYEQAQEWLKEQYAIERKRLEKRARKEAALKELIKSK